MKVLNKDGFAAIETLLVLVIVAMITGVGYYVWHAQKQTNVTLDAASKSAQSSSQKLTKKTATATIAPTITSTVFSKLPTSLQTAIINHAKSATPSCVSSDNKLMNDAGEPYDPVAIYAANKAVRVGECNAAALYAYHDNAWYFVEKTQYAFDCEALKQNEIPAALVVAGNSSQCLDANNNLVAYQG